jgi:hypothetical protein
VPVEPQDLGPSFRFQDLSDLKDPSIIPRAIEAANNARANAARSGGAGRTNARGGSATEIGSAFGVPGGSRGGGIPGDPAGLLRGVAVAAGGGDAGTSPSDSKRVLAYGEGGMGSTLPGGARLGAGSDGEAGIGGVRPGNGVGRAAIAVNAPDVIPVAPPTERGGAAVALGTFVRGRESELRFCYEESLKANPGLAGAVTVAISLSPTGSIARADVTRRTWKGAGAAEAESCMLQKIRGWRFSGSAGSGGTYAFPFSFTR